jgi:hypothetical protein
VNLSCLHICETWRQPTFFGFSLQYRVPTVRRVLLWNCPSFCQAIRSFNEGLRFAPQSANCSSSDVSIYSFPAYSSLEAGVLSHTGFVPIGDENDITPDRSEWRKPQFTGTYIRYVKIPCTVPSARAVLPVGNRLVGARWQDVDECPHAQL